MSDEKKKCCGEDVLFLGPSLSDGGRPFVRHLPDCTTQIGLARRAKEGEPIYDGALLVEPRQNEPGVFNVLGTHKTPGPARVATPEYREGWDRIFGGSTPVGQA